MYLPNEKPGDHILRGPVAPTQKSVFDHHRNREGGDDPVTTESGLDAAALLMGGIPGPGVIPALVAKEVCAVLDAGEVGPDPLAAVSEKQRDDAEARRRREDERLRREAEVRFVQEERSDEILEQISEIRKQLEQRISSLRARFPVPPSGISNQISNMEIELSTLHSLEEAVSAGGMDGDAAESELTEAFSIAEGRISTLDPPDEQEAAMARLGRIRKTTFRKEP